LPDDSTARNTRAALQVVYHTIAAAVLLLFVAFRLHKAVWALDSRSALVLLATAGVYWLAAVVLIAVEYRGRTISRADRLATSFAAAVLVFAAVTTFGSEPPRTLTLWAPLFGLGLLLLGQLLHARLTWPLVTVPAVLLGAAGLALLWAAPDWLNSPGRPAAQSAVAQFRIRSSLYDLAVTSFTNYTPRSAKPRGGLALLGDRYLLVTGDGQLLAFRPSADLRSLEVRALAYKVPLNSGGFVDASNGLFKADAFRVGGVIARETGGIYRIYVSHHHWKSADNCWVMRVSSLQGPLDAILSAAPTLSWKTEFETVPCMPLALPGQPPRFGALESGGRLAFLSDDRILVTIGDHAMNGWGSVVQAPQDEAYSFGKIIQINLGDGSSEIFSRGHRNAQGLTVAGDGRVWSTEHGPEGGDELNLIVKGGNYGWPFATYGTEYGGYSWPLIGDEGGDAAYVEPFLSWVPGLGVSGLIEVMTPKFDRWRGDLLMCTLRDQSFWRVRIREGRVVMTERFQFGQRIRDVIQGHDGTLVVWSDDRSISFIAPSQKEDVVSGASAYRICARCHVAPAQGVPATAPSLVGIVGRTVASDPDFAYSQALRDIRGTWTRERLDAFISDATAYAPGTTMATIAIPDAATRKAVIDYLASPDSRLDEMPDRRTRVETPQY
jgi:cytochrome c2